MSPFPFRNPTYSTGDGDSPEWQPPSYAKESDDSEEWSPPSYAKSVEEDKTLKPSIFSRIKSALSPSEKIHPSDSLNPGTKINKFLGDVLSEKSSHPMIKRFLTSQDPGQESVIPTYEEKGIKEPDTWMGGFKKGLYDEFVRPLGSAAGVAGVLALGEEGKTPKISELPIRKPSGEIPYRMGGSVSESSIPKSRVLENDINATAKIDKLKKDQYEFAGDSIKHPFVDNRDVNSRELSKILGYDDPNEYSEDSIRQPEAVHRDFGYDKPTESVPEQVSIQTPVKQPFVNPFEKKSSIESPSDITEMHGGIGGGIKPFFEENKEGLLAAEAASEKDLPIRSPNLDPNRFPIPEAASKSPVRPSDDILYDIARKKFNMGQDLPTEKTAPKAEFLALNEQNQPMYNIVNEDGSRSTFTGTDELSKRGIATPEIPKDAVPMKGSDIRAKFLIDKASKESGEAWKPPSYAEEAEDKTFKSGSFSKYEEGQKFADEVSGKSSSDEESNKEPQFMRVPIKGQERPNIAMGGADPRVLDVIGSSLYSKPRPLVTVKELLQNAFDEHRIIGQKEPIQVALSYGEKIPESKDSYTGLVVKDSGRGLTPDELYTVFTDVGKTGKSNEASASGGFGFAKAAPMLSGDYAKIESVVQEGKNKIKYSFEGNPKQMKDQIKGMKLNREILDPNEKTGLTVKTYFNKNTDTYEVPDTVKNIVENSPSITSPVHFTKSYDPKTLDKYLKNPVGKIDLEDIDNYSLKNMHENKKVFSSKSSQPIQDTIHTPGADINIHYEDKPIDTSDQYSLHYLNKGMYQDTTERYYGTPMDNVPRNITADIFAKVEEGSDDYPFTANREQVDKKISSAINKWVDDNIISGAQKKKQDKLIGLYKSLSKFPIKGTIRKSAMFDAGERLTSMEKASFYTNPIVQNVTKHFDGLINDIVTAVDSSRGSTARGDQLEGTGLLLGDENTYGIHIPNPDKTLTSPKSTILINWLTRMSTANPEDAAIHNTITALHEVAHISQDSASGFSAKDLKDIDDPRVGKYLKLYLDHLDDQGGINAGHGIAFLKRLGEIFTEFGPKQTFEAADRLHALTTDESGNYSPTIQKLLQIYKDSRGRPEVTEDFLSSTGVKQETPKGGKRDISSTNQSDGEGVPNIVNKLFKSLLDAKTRNVDQEAINKTERARRFAAFAGVKDEGASGASKSLSKLKGQFEKVNPGEALQLKSEETDSLFTAVKRAKITEGEKARGYTALFKILNGEAVPQRNELAILDDVFGNGFSDKITELHGGIGAVGLKIGKLANTMKTMENMLSLAAPLRHGIGLIAKKEFYPAFVDMFKFFGNKEYFNSSMQAIENHPQYLQSREAGLFLPKIASGADEEFLNSYVGDLPKASGIPMLASSSKRAYTGFLNKLKFDTYKSMIDRAEDLGYKLFDNTTKEDPTGIASKEAKGIANFINTFTGRGDLGRLNKITKELNLLLWSPRMMASRIQMFTSPKLYMDLPKEMRTEGLKSLLAIASLGTMIDTAASYAGAKVSTNILSTDFGKSRFGTQLIDPWGGLQQYVVGAARFLAGKTDSKTPTNRLEIAGRFLANKESPAVSLAHILLTAQKFTGKSDDPSTSGNFTTQYGEKTNIQSQIGKQFVPIFIQDLNDLMKSDSDWSNDIGLTAIMGAASVTGMSQSYPEKKQGTFKFKKMKP